jgi:pSer/pThr/pTyr-binding forkhead associated (FHA) protein
MTQKTVFKTTGRKSASRHNIVELEAGEWIFREGDLGTEMYIVQDGQVEILKTLGEDQFQQLLVLERGDFFGEMALLEDLPRAAGVRALQPTKLLEINGSTFDQMLRENPEIAVRMMRALSRRLRETDALVRKLGGQPSQAAPAPPMPEVGRSPRVGNGPERLVHNKSGMEFPLSGSETTIGRKDPVTGIYPDIDLSPVDQQRSISRRHAKIYRRGEKFFVAEEIGTMNGTFVNGERLETGVPSEMKPGDEVRFGVIETRFVLE